MHLKMRTDSSVERGYGRRAGLFVTSQNFDHFERQAPAHCIQCTIDSRGCICQYVVGARTHARTHGSQQGEHTCALLFPRIQYKTNLVTIWTRKETLLGEGAS
jgi:hypothetical protein